MRARTSWIVVAALFVAVLAFQATPASAQFPRAWSMVTWDAFGSLMDCIDIPNSATPAANAYLSGKRGKCTTIDGRS